MSWLLVYSHTYSSLHVVVLPVYVVVFSSRCGWWKALPVSPATSSKVQKVTVTGSGVNPTHHSSALTCLLFVFLLVGVAGVGARIL